VAQALFTLQGQQSVDAVAPFQAQFTVPAQPVTATLDLGIAATDLRGNGTTLARPVLLLADGTHVTGGLDLNAGDTSLDGRDLVLTAGNHRIDGTHQFNSLILLDGAILTQAATTNPATPARTELIVATDFRLTAGAR